MMRRWLGWARAAGAVGLFVVLVRVPPGGPRVGRAVDDVGQLIAAAGAAAACGWRAARSPGQAARSWWLLSAGTGCWAAGELAWSYYELVAGRQSPFPSVADAAAVLRNKASSAPPRTGDARALPRRREGGDHLY
jgi:hypothetical protein